MLTIKVAGLVLAAGRGSRFAASVGPTAPPSKMLAKWNGVALVNHVVTAARTAMLDPLLVVTGYAAREIEVEIGTQPVRFVHNADFESGLASSLKAGLAALPLDVDAVVILLGDMPLVSADVIAHLQASFADHPHVSAIVPTYKGRRGNPVVLSKKMFSRLADLEGDRGAAQILAVAGEDVLEIAIDDEAVSFDVDTVQALRASGSDL